MPAAPGPNSDDPLGRTADGGRSRALLRCGIAGPLLFIAVFLVDGATRAGYDPVRHPVSALALGDRGWIQVTNFVVTGGLVVAFAAGLRRCLESGPGATSAPLLLAAFGAGLMLSGFVMDPMLGYPPGAPEGVTPSSSWHAKLHEAAGLVVFTSLPAAAIVLARRFRRTGGSGLPAIHATAAGLAVAGGFVAFAIALEQESAFAGLVQRVAIIAGWTWVATLAASLRSRTWERP